MTTPDNRALWELAEASRAIVSAYRGMPDGELGKGLVNGHFLRIEDALKLFDAEAILERQQRWIRMRQWVAGALATLTDVVDSDMDSGDIITDANAAGEGEVVSTHTCHWPGCGKPVPPAMWGCKTHWFRLPKALRDRVWATYRPGQEITKTPSAAYLAVARDIQSWIKDNNP